MPERNPTKNPTVLVGSVIESGTPNTGQVPITYGGTKTFSAMSGAVGPDICIHVGAGRLDSVTIHPPSVRTVANGSDINSGLPITFYDSAVAVSGGPLSASGHKVIWKGFADYEKTVSGGFRTGRTVSLGYAFTSGLVHTTTSGQDGWTVSYTPVVSG
jgi:hypothetical protein